MIPDIETKLASWARFVLGDERLAIWLGAPGGQGDGAAVGLYLYELGEPPKSRTSSDGRVGALFRYLVTAWDASPGRANARIGQLLFAALDAPEAIALPGTEVEVDATPLAPALWQSFAVAARPAFSINIHAFQERAIRAAPVVGLVREPLIVDLAPAMTLTGQIVVPIAGRPATGLAGAYVEIPHLNRTTQTDAHGRFRFGAVPWPGKDQPLRLRVQARGHQQFFSIGSERSLDEPVILPFPITEP